MTTTLLADDELDRLETLLEDPTLEDAMRLDQAQGYLCAALAGPEPIATDDWLLTILGSEAALASAEGGEAASLLKRFAAVLEDGLAAGEAPVLLLYPKEADSEAAGGEDDESDYAPWCEGFLAAVDAAPQDWFEALGVDPDEEEENDETEYLDERLFPMLMLTGEAEEAAREHGEEWPEGEELEELEEECEESLPQAVADIYRFWLAKRGVAPLRRDETKVGRNEPCPCGSGKKFKQCCGAS